MLPISAVVTPSTLSVRPTTASIVVDDVVPTLNFSNFLQFEEGLAVGPPLTRLSKLVTSGVQIPPIEAFVANSSYKLENSGPSLKCGEPSPDVVRNIEAVFEATGGTATDNNNNTLQQMALYVAFTPFTPVTDSGRAWPLNDIGQVLSDSLAWIRFVELCLKVTQSHCSLLSPTIGGIPDNATDTVGKSIDTSNALWLRLGEERLVCSVQKTRYRVTFDARNPLTALKNYSYSWEGAFNADSNENIGFIVAIQPLLEVLRGLTYMAGRWCLLDNTQMTQCTPGTGYVISQTLIHETALTAMVYERAGEIRNRTWEDARNQGQDVYPPSPDRIPIADPRDSLLTRNFTLREIIEEMSRNVTLSYFSDARYFHPGGIRINMTTTTPVNVYHYNRRSLVLAYSIAFGISGLAVLLGLHVFIANGCLNCTANFSAILCATIRNPGLGKLIEESTITDDPKINSSSMIAGPGVLKLGLR